MFFSKIIATKGQDFIPKDFRIYCNRGKMFSLDSKMFFQNLLQQEVNDSTA